ncbi:MAG: M20/M25/M40 family metallo-hydrolase, partial [Deltaproteobacteria bacterium]|nr:M20/M25/M40 family metallo-hydrolase [Deltaproteobacteria bacterium]
MSLPTGFLDNARALIRADSTSAKGNRAAIDVLVPLFEGAGLTVEQDAWRESIDGAPDAEHINVIAGPGGGGAWTKKGAKPDTLRGGIVFVTHTDTVPSGPKDRWTETGKDPHALTEKNGELFGLGVADVKLDMLCKIEAAKRCNNKKLARPFWLVGTAAEEVGLRGATRFSKSDRFNKIAPTAVLCGEPSELALIRAHKGYAVVRCTVTDAEAPLVTLGDLNSDSDEPVYGVVEKVFAGKAVHSSTPKLGVNAVQKALTWLARWDAPVVSISGGQAANVVPAKCALRVPAPNNDPADQTQMLKAQAPSPDLRRAIRALSSLEMLWKELIGTLTPKTDDRFDPPDAPGAMNLIEGGAFEGKARVMGLFDA